jgi:hypothetical protein
MKLKHNGQSMVEFIVLAMIVIFALVAMNTYIKRGFQGRWKQSVDDFGDQYDPAKVNSVVRYSSQAQSQTMVQAVPLLNPQTGQTEYFTNRIDSSSSSESKSGNVFVSQ